MDGSDAPRISVSGVSRRFRSGVYDVMALRDVSLDVFGGRLTVLAGPSGSGKSTLLSIMGCLDRPTSGTVAVLGRPVHAMSRAERRTFRRTTVATIVPQPADNLRFGLSGREHLELVTRLRGSGPVDVQRSIDVLGIGGFVDRLVDTMSGGEQMRVALAGVLAGRSRVLLIDEPTAALDAASARIVVSALHELATGGAAVVVASHDAVVIDAAADVVRLDDGRRVR